MKLGDLVADDCDQRIGLVVSDPRPSTNRDHSVLGVMNGDMYEVVDVLRPEGYTAVYTTDELTVISEGR